MLQKLSEFYFGTHTAVVGVVAFGNEAPQGAYVGCTRGRQTCKEDEGS